MNAFLELLPALAPIGIIGAVTLMWTVVDLAQKRLLWLATGITRPERYLDD